MKKINFAPQITERFTIDGNDIMVVSIPAIEAVRIAQQEKRLATIVAKRELEEDKDDLLITPFDALAWVENWVNKYATNILDNINDSTIDRDSWVKQWIEKNVPQGKFSTYYAQVNEGAKPPQNAYEVELAKLIYNYKTYGVLHHLMRDENGGLFFDPVEDYKNQSYSEQRAVLTEMYLRSDIEFRMAVQFAAAGNLLGFTSWKATQKEANEKPETQTTGETE